MYGMRLLSSHCAVSATDHLMHAGHEQPVRDNANVHMLIRQSLQCLRDPRKRLHRRIQMLTLRGFVRFDVIVERLERPSVLAREIVMRGLQRTFRHVNALPLQVIADRAPCNLRKRRPNRD